MIKLLFVLIASLIFNTHFAQELIEIGEYSNSGYVDSLVWKDLNEWEKGAYLQSLAAFNINPDSVIWVSAQTQRNLIKDHDCYNAKCITLFSDDTKQGYVEKRGRNSLAKPECIVFIFRENGLSTVKLVVYY
ncbi:MAG: hypothetical protein ACKOZM_07300 [Flavobacteriales bacterium]